HLAVLDRFAGLEPAREEFGQRVHELRALQSRIADIDSSSRELAQKVDLLTFQIREIEDAKLRPGEDDELENERSVLSNAERIMVEADHAYTLLSGGEDFATEVGASSPVLM